MNADTAAKMVAEEMVLAKVARKVAFDPFTILAIVSVIVAVIRLLIECRKKPKEVAQIFKKPELVERWRLRRLIKQILADEEAEKELSKALQKSFFAVGQRLSEKDVEILMKEVHEADQK